KASGFSKTCVSCLRQQRQSDRKRAAANKENDLPGSDTDPPSDAIEDLPVGCGLQEAEDIVSFEVRINFDRGLLRNAEDSRAIADKLSMDIWKNMKYRLL
ncbi:hypothetical protein H0H92_000641, partial [Tricholoma furcatifolium]